jgi:formylglycine-generating enzyme required for sulfatase activity
MTANTPRAEPQPIAWPREIVTGGSPSRARIVSALTIVAPAKAAAKQVDLGGGVTLEVVYFPPGEFMMGSTPEERTWATAIEGGATPGTSREKPEGDPRPVRVKHGFWMARTETSVGQFRRFVEESGYVTDAEKPGGWTQCFDPQWDGYHPTTKVVAWDAPWLANRRNSAATSGCPQSPKTASLAPLPKLTWILEIRRGGKEWNS